MIRVGGRGVAGDRCAPTGLTDPVAEAPHADGCSVTGGYVYRGAAVHRLVAVPEL